jgi:ubiquitin C-terminal hydrolase
MDSSASPISADQLLLLALKRILTNIFICQIASSPASMLSFRPKPTRGLPNLGSTCFLNASLAALYYTYDIDQFVRALSTGPVSELMTEFMNLYQFADDMQDWVWRLLHHFPQFADGRQHCAGSFLLYFLQALDAESEESEGFTSEAIKQYVKGRKSKPLHEMFSVVQINVFTCVNCGDIKESKMYSRVLALPIPTQCDEISLFFNKNDFFSPVAYDLYESSRELYHSALIDISSGSLRRTLKWRHQVSLLNCMQYLCRAHLMEDQNRLNCENCGDLRNHFKQSFVTHIGSVLVLHLQRYDKNAGNKLETYVSAVDEELDLTAFGPALGKYQLTAVICHIGSMDFGHYIANVKAEDGWWQLNDSHIRQISAEVVYDNAILLYYRKLSS